ncbi:MAG: hypothetical protein ACOZE5_12370 [Verrucomicrobiota bacterium]
MNHSTETSPEQTLFNENGVLITAHHVRTQNGNYPLTGSAFSRTRSTDCLEVDPVATARVRRRVLRWGGAAGLAVALWAGLSHAGTVQEHFYLTDGRTIGERQAQAIAFGIATGICALALGGALLCARVSRPYKLHNVYLDTDGSRRLIASSRNEAWITAIAAALDKAIARLSVAATDQSAGSRAAS